MSASFEDAKAMEDILKKLDSVTTASTKRLVEASEQNVDLKIALNTSKSTKGIQVANYEIIPEKHTINGLRKNYYTIAEDGEVLHSDISLFESAMSIVKRYMLNKRLQDIDTILTLDQQYDANLIESYSYKYKLKTINESVKRDVYEAKYSNSLGKVKSTKQRILKTL